MSLQQVRVFDDDVARLRDAVAGDVFTATDPEYEVACRPWNLAWEQRPVVAVVAAHTADVAAAIGFARRHELGVGVQSTGHGFARSGTDQVLVLTHRMDGVRVDPDTSTAWVGAGASWGQVLEPAQSVGMAPLLGSTPHVGAVGYTLGGGLGWLARAHGLAADTVHWLEVVLADGSVARVSPEEHPDLFWALRGGGAGSLGVVTGMQIGLVEVDQVYGGNLLYPVEVAGEVLARWRDWVADARPELTSSVLVMHYPPIEAVPEPVRGQSFAIVRGCWSGPIDEGERIVSSWRAWREPALDLFGPMSFADVGTISNDPVDPVHGASATAWVDDVDDELITTIIDMAVPTAGPSPLVFLEVRHVGHDNEAAPWEGGMPTGAADLPSQLLVQAVAMVPDRTMLPALEAAVAAVDAALGPHANGRVYLNFLEGEAKRTRTADGFTPEAWRRLVAVKRRYDPTDVFRYGLAIPTA